MLLKSSMTQCTKNRVNRVLYTILYTSARLDRTQKGLRLNYLKSEAVQASGVASLADSPHQGSTLHNGEQAQDLCLLLPLHRINNT
jgi:hypothetical protein